MVEDRRSDAVAHLAVRVRSQNTGLIRAFVFMKKIKELYNKIYEFGQLCKRNHLDSHSAAAAFFMFVSIIPFIILVLAIIPFTPVTDANILAIAEAFLPNRLDSYAVDIMNQLSEESLTLVSVSAVVAMWTAARSLLTIKQGLNEIHGVTETRNFLILRGIAVLYTVVLILSILLMLVMNVVFTGIERYFREALGISISAKYDLVYILLTLRPLISLILAFFVNLYFFTFLPNERVKMRTQIPGAILVAVAWYVFSTGFGIYINYFNAYSMYGSLSIVIIVLFWLYACMYILFLGGQFNYYLSLKREK